MGHGAQKKSSTGPGTATNGARSGRRQVATGPRRWMPAYANALAAYMNNLYRDGTPFDARIALAALGDEIGTKTAKQVTEKASQLKQKHLAEMTPLSVTQTSALAGIYRRNRAACCVSSRTDLCASA